MHFLHEVKLISSRAIKFILLTILVTASVSCLAQEANKFSLGVKTGAGVAGWHASPEYPIPLLPSQIYANRFVPAFALGLTNSYNVVQRFAVNMDLLYLRGGSKFTNNYEIRNTSEVLVYSSEARLRLHSLRTPLYLSWVIKKGRVKPFIKVGITANWILGGDRLVDIQNPFTGETIEEKRDFPDEIRKMGLMQDWSFYSGIGIAVSQRLLFEVDLWLGPPRDYSVLDANNGFFYCPNCLSIVPNFETSYHNRAILLGLRYIIIK